MPIFFLPSVSTTVSLERETILGTVAFLMTSFGQSQKWSCVGFALSFRGKQTNQKKAYISRAMMIEQISIHFASHCLDEFLSLATMSSFIFFKPFSGAENTSYIVADH